MGAFMGRQFEEKSPDYRLCYVVRWRQYCDDFEMVCVGGWEGGCVHMWQRVWVTVAECTMKSLYYCRYLIMPTT